MKATRMGEQAQLLEEALRLNRFALAQEKARLAKLAVGCETPQAGERA